MEVILVALFHRASATLYAIYAAWAVIAFSTGIPSLVAANGQLWQVIFSGLTLITAAPACFGATFWPVFARLEALAGSSFVGLIAVYTATIFYAAVIGEGPWAGVVIILSVLVMPLCRTIVVIVLLLRQSKEDRAIRIQAQKIAIRQEIAEVTATRQARRS